MRGVPGTEPSTQEALCWCFVVIFYYFLLDFPRS